MRLFATLGATRVGKEHLYEIESKTYSVKISLLALKEHFGISDKDVYIIGTQRTKEVLGDVIEGFNFIQINEDSLENVFETAVKYIQKDDIVDLTQGFRSFPFGVFLALNFSKLLKKDPYDVFYAQVMDIGCDYRNETCKHKFVSLKKYLEIGDLAREINGFVSSWYVAPNEIDNFSLIHENLCTLSKKLLSNNIDVLKELSLIQNEISKLKKEFGFLSGHLDLLYSEASGIYAALKNGREYMKFYEMAKLYYSKGLLLQTLTMLFEAISAYLADIVPHNFSCRKHDVEYTKRSKNRYAFRNCVKNTLRSEKGCERWWFKTLRNCKEFRENLLKIDEMRNDSAHAFINKKALENFHSEIGELIGFFGEYMK